MAWTDIRGHERIEHDLRSAYRSGRLAHAYLFVGPSGIGKRRFAVELAKAILCESSTGVLAACDRCPACLQAMAGTHPDLIQAERPDDKQDIPIELIRELCANLGLKAARGERKVLILDDADDLNDASANAFLKTLEEPPPGTLIVLLATQADSQLSTVTSRCQVLNFRPLPGDAIRELLADRLESPLSVDRLDRVVNEARGSVAKALLLAEEKAWAIREHIIDVLGQPAPDSANLAAEAIAFAELAGKEGVMQRPRASLVVRLAGEIAGEALRVKLGSMASNPSDAAPLKRAALRHDEAEWLDKLEACVEAERSIDRKVPIALVLEHLADELCRK